MTVLISAKVYSVLSEGSDLYCNMSVKKGKKAGKVARAVVSALVQGGGGDAEDQEHLEGGGGEGDVTTAKLVESDVEDDDDDIWKLDFEDGQAAKSQKASV